MQFFRRANQTTWYFGLVWNWPKFSDIEIETKVCILTQFDSNVQF